MNNVKFDLFKTQKICKHDYYENIIPFFGKGDFFCFSQFYFSDFTFSMVHIPKKLIDLFHEKLGSTILQEKLLENKTFNCCEKFMMAGKCMIFDPKSFDELYMITTPAKCKEFGRKCIKNFDSVIWDSVSIYWVIIGNYLKFIQNKKLKKILKDTNGYFLVEASPYDRIWGIGISESHPDINKPNKWKGSNKLGDVLMTVRDII